MSVSTKTVINRLQDQFKKLDSEEKIRFAEKVAGKRHLNETIEKFSK